MSLRLFCRRSESDQSDGIEYKHELSGPDTALSALEYVCAVDGIDVKAR